MFPCGPLGGKGLNKYWTFDELHGYIYSIIATTITHSFLYCSTFSCMLTHYCLTGTFLPTLPKFDFILRRDHQKISYERCAYESVDEKSLS